MSGRILLCLAIVVVGLMVFFVGCAEQAEPVLTADKEVQPDSPVAEPEPIEPKVVEAVEPESIEPVTAEAEPAAEQVVSSLALKFEPGQVKYYREISEYIKDFKHEKPWPEESEIRKSTTRTEIVFLERIENVTDAGSAVAKITIDYLKQFSESPNGAQIDFYSNRPGNEDDPLNELIGQSYSIKISPSGRIEVIDANQARSAVASGSASELVLYLLSDAQIVKRHSILALPEDGNKEFKTGDNWSRTEGSPKEMLQPKIYEKVYTLEKIRKQDQRRLAVVKMEATATDWSVPGKMDLSGVEQSDSFQGLLIIDPDTGALVQYSEKLIAEWIAAGKSESQGQDEDEPKVSVLVISFSYLQSLEIVD